MIRDTYFLEDYEVHFHIRRYNLRQKELSVSLYNKEFHNICIRSRMVDLESVKVARYLIGLRYNIQEEVAILSSTKVNKCFQLAKKIEEKIKRTHDDSKRGRGEINNQKRVRGNFSRNLDHQHNEKRNYSYRGESSH